MTYDALVIGAGPAGSTAALLLARAGWSVAVVEKSEFPRRKVCGEFISAPALSLLARVGLAEDVLAGAGPEIRELAIYAGERVITAPMPRGEGAMPYGRALGREHLDTLLLAAAQRAGAAVWQPWRVRQVERADGGYRCSIEAQADEPRRDLRAPVVIAAYGSWDTGRLQRSRAPARGSDLLAFKAHFEGGTLGAGCMPLVTFPGGYGGLVTSDAGRLSFSCCIRRDALADCRAEAPAAPAGAAVLARVFGACRGMREAVGHAVRSDVWLAAGPLRPGLRSPCGEGHFAVGNAMGEAHPIVAEGISMAIQSSWLLCERLIAARSGRPDWNAVAREYESAYRRAFGLRIRASAAYAAIAVRPRTAAAVGGLLERVPGLVALGARWAGKVRPLYAAA